MALDWKKLGIYAALAAVIAAGVAVYHQPDRPPPPVVVKAPAVVPTPEPPPAVIEPPAPAAPPPAVKPAPVVKPAPAPKAASKPAPKSRFTPRPVNLSPGCAHVPSAAYAHPLDVVVSAAVRFGTPPDKVEILKRCWHGERVPYV